jgi:apolipoprotein N-acyltransferase
MERLIGDPLKAIALILAAVLIGTSFAGSGVSALAWIGLAIVGVLVAGQQFRLMPLYLAGVALQLSSVDWMRHCYSVSALTESRVSNWAVLGLVYGLVLPLTFFLAIRMNKHWPLWLSLPVAWTVGDFLRYQSGYLISGGPYPWVTLGLSQTDWLVLCQVADIGGIWAVGFVVAMIAGMAAQIFVTRRVPALPLVIVAAVLVYGGWRLREIQAAAGPRFALIPGTLKTIPDEVEFAMWPETAFGSHTPMDSTAVLLQGCRRGGDSTTFNSLAVISGQEPVCFYDKCNLVPWSEFEPWGGTSRFVAGESPGIFTAGGYRFGVAICYDVCFPGFLRRIARENPQFIAIAANEASDPTQVLAYQLLCHAKLRAIETRRAIVRNANGGFSGVIDGCGRFALSDARLRPATTLALPLDVRTSPYAWAGDWLPLACLLLVGLSGLHSITKHESRHQTQQADDAHPKPD